MEGLTPSQKGAVAEAAITAAVIEQGLTVLRPLCEGRRYDLVIDLEPELLRIQCKLAQLVGGVLRVRLQSNRLTTSGYRRASYTAAEIDAVAVHSPDLRMNYMLPIGAVCGRNAIHLRIDPARNRQRDRINWARDYDLMTVMATMRGASGDS